jgi:glutathione synthase
MKTGFQMDHLSALNFKTDSTLPIIYESQKRKNTNYIYHPRELYLKNNKVFALANSISFSSSNYQKYTLGKKEKLLLDSLDFLFIRQDPPYNMSYISSMHLLELVNSKTRIINNPHGIRNAPEKLLMLKFPKLIPPTLITKSKDEVNKFMTQYNQCVVKPLYGNGGEDIFFLNKKDKNYNQILEAFLKKNNEPFIIQKFLPEIKKGVKRIIIIDGNPVGAVKRMPKGNEIRSNIHVGGKCVKTRLSKRDLQICESIRKELIDNCLFFVGIDVIGNFLTEINVTSPTCIQEIKQLYKIDIAEIIWDKL